MNGPFNPYTAPLATDSPEPTSPKGDILGLAALVLPLVNLGLLLVGLALKHLFLVNTFPTIGFVVVIVLLAIDGRRWGVHWAYNLGLFCLFPIFYPLYFLARKKNGAPPRAFLALAVVVAHIAVGLAVNHILLES